jgi:outer membrane protein
MESNVAVVHIGRLLDESKRGKVLTGTLRAAAEKWQKEIAEAERQFNELRAKAEQLPNDTAVDARFKIDRDLKLHEMDLRHLQQKARLDIESRRDQARTRVLQEAEPILTKLAEEHRLSLVLSVPSREVAYAAPAIDLTAELLTRFDAES